MVTAVVSWAAEHTGPWVGISLAAAALLTIGAILIGIAIGSVVARRRG